MMLADSAQAIDNKLYILGGGWTLTGPQPAPSAIALYIKVPWDEANRRHRLRLELVDPDGAAILFDTPEGRQSLQVESEFEVGRPPGLKPGTPIELSMAINIGPIPLQPGGRFEWRLSIDEESSELWTLPFGTRA